MTPVKVTIRRSITAELPSNPVLPASLVVQRAQAEESTELAALLHSAYPTEGWEPEATKQEVFYDKTVKAPMVVVSKNRILATASLQIRSDTPEHGWVRWGCNNSRPTPRRLSADVSDQITRNCIRRRLSGSPSWHYDRSNRSNQDVSKPGVRTSCH